MRFALALFALAGLLLSGCGPETNYCVGTATDGTCQYFQAPDKCANPVWCASAGGYAIHMSTPSSCTKITAPISCQ
ncbi:MAG: hypothetical protein QM723_11850 [Myxococcaceae bacterium]